LRSPRLSKGQSRLTIELGEAGSRPPRDLRACLLPTSRAVKLRWTILVEWRWRDRKICFHRPEKIGRKSVLPVIDPRVGFCRREVDSVIERVPTRFGARHRA